MKLGTAVKSILFATAMSYPLAVVAEEGGGKALYDEHCAACHGDKLQGGIGSSFLDRVWNYGGQPFLIGMNVKYGLPNLEMPAWEGKLSDDEIMSIIGYILAEEKKSDLTPPPMARQAKTELYNLKIDILADHLDTPWAMAFTSVTQALITDRAGKIYLMENGVVQKDAIKDTPDDIIQGGQAGLLDIALDPEYDKNGWIYLSYSHLLSPTDDPKKMKSFTRIVRGRITDGRWHDQEIIWQADDKFYTTMRHHYGSRIVFDRKGDLYFSVGDRGVMKQAQDITQPNGKIHRIHRDGRIPTDNPFIGQPDAVTSIFTYGNRNPQGMATHPVTGGIWSTEHGPMGGDELNHIRRGLNYGWPEITYGRDYDGSTISKYTSKPGMEQPVTHWTPSIAVADIDFHPGKMFPKWKNDLLVTSLKYRELRRLVVKEGKVTHQEILLKGLGRTRSVTVAPDGAIYLLLKDPSLVLRVSPQAE